MKFFVNSLHFVTMPFIFNKSYDEVTEFLKNIAIPRSELKHKYSQKFLDFFVDNLFNFCSVNRSITPTIFDKIGDSENNINDCKINDFSLFFINNTDVVDKFINNFKSKCLSCLKTFVEKIKEYNNLLGTNSDDWFTFGDGLIKEIQSIISTEKRQDECLELRFAKRMKSELTVVNNSIHSSSLVKIEPYRAFKEADKAFDYYYKTVSLSAMLKDENGGSSILPVVFVSKNKVLNISFAFSQKSDIFSSGTKQSYEFAATNCANGINRTSYLLASLYKYIKDKYLFQEITDGLGIMLDDDYPALKGIYNNFIYDNRDKEIEPDACGEEIRRVFDYISSATAFSNSYDNHYLWVYAHLDKKDNPVIKEYGNGVTVHFLISEKTYSYSVINPSYFHDEKIDDSHHFPLQSALKVPFISHQTKIYSLQKFLSICAALIFGTNGDYVMKMFIAICTGKMNATALKIARMYRFHKLVIVGSKLLRMYNTDYFSNKKEDLEITNIVFDKVGLTNINKSVINLLDYGWKDGNLVTNQTYSRYSMIMGLGSLFVSLFSYGMISKVYIDGYFRLTEENANQPPRSISGLIHDTFNTPKFYLVTLICLLPVLIWCGFSLVEYIKIKIFNVGDEYLKIISKEKNDDENSNDDNANQIAQSTKQ